MKPNWIKKIIMLALPLFLAAAGVAQSGPPGLPTGQVIGYWGFDDTNWLTAWNLPPRAAANLNSVSSWSGNALQIDSGDPAYLIYNFVDTSEMGRSVTNVSPVGSLEFWYAPDWNSDEGPGNWGRLLEIGDFSDSNYPSAFGLYLAPDGTGLFVSGRTNAAKINFLLADISWNAGEWHYVILTYDQTGTNTVL